MIANDFISVKNSGYQSCFKEFLKIEVWQWYYSDCFAQLTKCTCPPTKIIKINLQFETESWELVGMGLGNCTIA